MPFDFDSNPLTLSGLWPNTTTPIQVDVYGYCQMSCFYCFSNLNKQAAGRKINAKNSTPRLFSQLDKAMSDPHSPIGWMMREKYVVGFSNTTDPFQREEKTHRSTEAFLTWAANNAQPVYLETKGNVLLEEWGRYSDLIDPARVVVYLSLSMLDDKLRKRLEPGALTVQGRLELIAKLAAKEVRVIAACNPYVHDWCPDMDLYCKTVAAAGSRYVFPFPLHFSQTQTPEIPTAYASEVLKANLLPMAKVAAFTRWQEACARHRLRCCLAEYWDALFDFPCQRSKENDVLAGIGKTFLHLHQFACEAADFSKANGGRPVLFSWPIVEHSLRQQGLQNVMLNTSAFDSVVAHSSEKHRQWKALIGKQIGYLEMMRALFNAPWLTQKVAWRNPNTFVFFKKDKKRYWQTPDGDKIGVMLPGKTRSEKYIDKVDFDFANCVYFDPPAKEKPCSTKSSNALCLS